MNITTLNLIKLVNKITLPEEFPLRDVHYEIVHSYNEGNPGWYLAHDGKIWTMEEYLPPSQNGFNSMANAERALQRVLLDVSRDYLQAAKDANEDAGRIAALEIEYLAEEIAF